MKVLVPGNLLLFGEYIVTESGGKGIGAAIDTHAIITAKRSDKTSVLCKYQGNSHFWNGESSLSVELPLIACVLEHIELLKPLFPLEISIDTSHFSYPDGRKKGFGSSAAVVAGLTYLLLYFISSKVPDLLRDVFPLALKIHRDFQGGRGSGYDIAASLFGGIGLFTGGELPLWKPINTNWSEHLFLLPGEEAVSTKELLKQFHAFKTKNPEQAQAFFIETNRLTEQMVVCKNVEEASCIFAETCALNIKMHEAIGAPVEGSYLNYKLKNYFQAGFSGKPLGAGSEIAAILGAPPLPDPLEPLKISPHGLRTCHL